MPELKPYREGVYLWHYVPSKPAAIAFMAAYAAISAAIIYKMVRTRSWFNIPFILGGLMEFVGYGARALCTERTDNLTLYAIQFILILIAPALLAASIYMALSRLIRSLRAESQSIISPRWLTRLFVFGDVLSFIIQLGGGAIATNPDANPDIAKWTILVGLLLQIAFFGLFMITAVIFHKRMRSWQSMGTPSAFNWLSVLFMLYIVSALVMVRSIFRVIEYTMGFDSYLFKKEWPIYVFDGVLMLIAMIVWGFRFPGDLTAFAAVGKAQDEIPLYAQTQYGMPHGHQPPPFHSHPNMSR